MTPRPSPTPSPARASSWARSATWRPSRSAGEPIDHRADIFALGVVMHEMLSGARPFQRDTTPETLTAILKDDAPELPAARDASARARRRPLPREAPRGSIPFRARSRPRARGAVHDDRVGTVPPRAGPRAAACRAARRCVYGAASLGAAGVGTRGRRVARWPARGRRRCRRSAG